MWNFPSAVDENHIGKGTSAFICATCRQEEVYCSVFQEFSKQFNKQTNGKHGYSPVTEFSKSR